MSEQNLILLGVLAVVAVVGVVVFRVISGQRNEAGISTSMGARGAQVSSLVSRSIWRKLWLKFRQMWATHEHKKALEEEYHLKSAEEAAKIMGNMKGVFMKLGQIISFANDSLPPAAQEALRGLQSDSPPMDFKLVRQQIESELGKDLGELFKDVDEQPLAAASIGQVHKAKLHDGTVVALKVQYPGVDTAIENDLKASAGLAAMINMVNKNVDAKAVVRELKERLYDELDYRQEMRNQQLFAELWDGHPYIRVPKVFPEFCTKRVLCQEFKKGLNFYDFLETATDKERELAVYVLHDFVFDSMHIHHVFNGDPHPGNYIFNEDGGITFIDFGCIKYFDDGFIHKLQGISRAVVEKDRDAFDQLVMDLGLILPGRPYDREWMWDFFGYHSAPFKEDRKFEFTPEWVAQAGEVMDPQKLQQMNLPPDLLFFNRITFGLNAIMQKLGANFNWHVAARRYLYESENVPPSLALQGIELPEKFLPSRQHGARRVEQVAQRPAE
ncbi:MAG: AarF/ABC1/UbiB kinase family protein [Chrysiogenetes bacterium]|nr:AarF/ABC1/UbiB kinase family protein [Chrysiogenetes bacterium]